MAVLVVELSDDIKFTKNEVEDIPRRVEILLDLIGYPDTYLAFQQDVKFVSLGPKLAQDLSLLVGFVLHHFIHFPFVFAREYRGGGGRVLGPFGAGRGGCDTLGHEEFDVVDHEGVNVFLVLLTSLFVRLK